MLVRGVFLNENAFRIVTEIQKAEITKRLSAEKHYIVTLKQFRVKRIWTKTCDERRAWGEVHIDKQCREVSIPLIQINCISDLIKKLKLQSQKPNRIFQKDKKYD